MIKILDTPGFLLTKKTANILRLNAAPELITPCLEEAKDKRDAGEFRLSRGYNEAGQAIRLPRSRRGTHQAHVGYGVVKLNMWLKPILNEYASSNFFCEGKVLVKTQDYYLWYDPGFGISLHADDSTNGSSDYHRVITILIYLNSDYEGGEINFPSHELTIKPIPGETLIFPSNRLFKHEVFPIISGERFAIMQTWNLVNP